jgi:UDP-N-acetylmuramyl pentapeptide synthase
VCSIRDVAAVTDGRLRLASLPPLDGELEPFGRVITEIENVSDGDVFWALPGRNAAATGFVEAAFSRGAQGVVVSRRRIEPWAGRFVLEVADAEASLFELAEWSRNQWTGTVAIAVQTCDQPRIGRWITNLLRTRFPATRRVTVTHPGQLAAAACNWPREMEYGVVEVDAASRVMLKQATQLFGPQIGVVSALGESIHKRYAKWEPVKEGLAVLTAAIPPEGWLVSDGDEPELDELACLRRCHLMRVGCDPSCDVAATHIEYEAGRTTFRIRGKRYTFCGDRKKDLAAVLVALGVARIAGLTTAEIAAGLTKIEATKHLSGDAA